MGNKVQKLRNLSKSQELHNIVLIMYKDLANEVYDKQMRYMISESYL